MFSSTQHRRQCSTTKTLDSISMRHVRRGKQILTDLRYLMAVLDAEVERKGLTTQGLRTQLEASEIFEQIKEGVDKHHTTSNRKETLKWQTWVQKCRQTGALRIVDVYFLFFVDEASMKPRLFVSLVFLSFSLANRQVIQST